MAKDERPNRQIKLWYSLAKEYLGGKCVDCGTQETLNIHHKDCNYRNNDVANLELVCRKHHWIRHTKYKPVSSISGHHSELIPQRKNPIQTIRFGNGNMTQVYCNRCGHIWFLRTNHFPKVCSQCKNLKWNEMIE